MQRDAQREWMKLRYCSRGAITWTKSQNSEEVLNRFISAKWVISHWGWYVVVWKEHFLRVQYRSQLVIRLIANKCYEDTFYFLFFLPLPSGPFICCLVPFVIRFLFVRLIEVVARRHSPWNYPAFLPYIGIRYHPDLFWAYDLVDQLSSHLSPTKLLGWVL